MAVDVRYNSLYISLPSSAKQQCEMTNSELKNVNYDGYVFLKCGFKFIAESVSRQLGQV